MLFLEIKIVAMIMTIIVYYVDATISSKYLMPDGFDLCMRKTNAGSFRTYQHRVDRHQQRCIKFRTTPIVYSSKNTSAENQKFSLDYNFQYRKTLFQPLRSIGCALNTIGWCHLFGVGEFNDCLDQLKAKGFDTYDFSLVKEKYSMAVPNSYSNKYKTLSLSNKLDPQKTDEEQKNPEDYPEDSSLEIEDVGRSKYFDAEDKEEIDDDTENTLKSDVEIKVSGSSTSVDSNNLFKIKIPIGNAERYAIYISHFENGSLEVFNILSPPVFCQNRCKEEMTFAGFTQVSNDEDKEKLKKKYEKKVPSNTLKDNKSVPVGGYADQYALFLLAYDKFSKNREEIEWCAVLFEQFITETKQLKGLLSLRPEGFDSGIN